MYDISQNLLFAVAVFQDYVTQSMSRAVQGTSATYRIAAFLVMSGG